MSTLELITGPILVAIALACLVVAVVIHVRGSLRLLRQARRIRKGRRQE
ncbi:MAG: hypothetical protein Q8P59_05765 [Dehalococcoidia bacterium]|nr:hypothetical protein [Dehalococcoidia bacterium]